jgi:hypothetical protein
LSTVPCPGAYHGERKLSADPDGRMTMERDLTLANRLAGMSGADLGAGSDF